MVLLFYCQGQLEETGSGSDRVIGQNEYVMLDNRSLANQAVIEQISYFIEKDVR